MATEEFRISSVIPTSSNALYSAWLDERKHSAFTGGRATIEPWVGGRLSAWDGYIEARLNALDIGRRIVMTWRTTDFPADAPPSFVEVLFDPIPGGTRMTVVHYDIPEGQVEQYKKGWRSNYLDPIRKFFTKPGAMRAAIKAASKARRLPIPGITTTPPGSVRAPMGRPRPTEKKKTAKVTPKKAAARRATEKTPAKPAAAKKTAVKKTPAKPAAAKKKAPAKKKTAAKKKPAKKRG